MSVGGEPLVLVWPHLLKFHKEMCLHFQFSHRGGSKESERERGREGGREGREGKKKREQRKKEREGGRERERAEKSRTENNRAQRPFLSCNVS